MIHRSLKGLFFVAITVLGACGTPDTQITKLTPDLTVAPESIEFGDVVTTFEIERTVQLINAGRATLGKPTGFSLHSRVPTPAKSPVCYGHRIPT